MKTNVNIPFRKVHEFVSGKELFAFVMLNGKPVLFAWAL